MKSVVEWGGGDFRTRTKRLWGPPTLQYNGYWISFPGVKRPRRGVEHPPPYNAKVQKDYSFACTLSGPLWPVLGWTLSLPLLAVTCLLGSSVGIATELRAGRSRIESRLGRDFPPVETSPGAHPASCKMGTGSFPGVKCGQVVLLTTHPILVPRSWKSRAIPLPTVWATPGL